MNLYRNLISNTVLFGISTFGARFLTFLLTPFYTRVLSSTEYGITDLLIQTGNLIIPIASVGIANGVIRYGLERSSNKASVFTTGILVTLAGFFVLALASPLLDQLTFLSGHVRLVLLYVLAANLHSICNQFARALGHVRLFALDGILRTVLTILLNILLLAVFPLGPSAMCWPTYWPTELPRYLCFLPRKSGDTCVCRPSPGRKPDGCSGTARRWCPAPFAAGSSTSRTGI